MRAEYGVPLTEDLSKAELLAKAILANNEAKVTHLLLETPLLKNVTLTYEKRAYAGDEKPVLIVDMPVIEVILSRSALSLSMLDKCFGTHWWLDEDIYSSVSLTKMYEILKHIKPDDRAQFLQLNCVVGKLGSVCYVGQILDLLPRNFKLSYLRLHRPKEANFSWMMNVIPHLAVTHRCNGQIQIKSESDVKHMPAFIFDNLHLITSGFEVSWFMPHLTQPDRELLLERCADKLTTPRCLASLVSHIVPENLLTFSINYNHLLQSAHVIFTVLKKLPLEDKAHFLQTHFARYSKSADALTYFLRVYSQFTDPVMHTFILSNIKIETAKELVTALSDDCDEVRAEDYLHIVQYYKHLITTEDIFVDVKKRMRKGTATNFTQMHDELLGVEPSSLSMFMRSLIRR